VSRYVERLLAGADPPLTLAQYLALERLSAGGVLGADLARAAAVSPAAASQLLAGLEDAGLVERTRPAGDRRRQPVALTENGRAALGSARELVRGRLGALLSELPPPEADALWRSLEQVESFLAGTPPPPRPPRPPHGPPGPKRP
jgi:DNA-binding MarR family transcriptional regulator